MALNRPTCVSTWATAATSPIQEGVEGADSGFTWIVTDVCVILGVCPPLWETEIFTSFLTRRHISLVFSKLLLTKCKVAVRWADKEEKGDLRRTSKRQEKEQHQHANDV